MTLSVWTTNPYTKLSMSDIELEFVGNRQQNVPIVLSDYYSDSYTGYVSSDRVGYPFGIETPIPQIGNTISISNFYGASSVSYTITTDRVSYDEGDVVIFSITAPLIDGTQLYWTIEDATVNISITPAARYLPTASRNILYNPQQLVASGGTGPYTYTVTYGSLPSGMSLSSNGLITGTPTSIGTSLFAVTAADSDNNSGFKIYSLPVQTVPITLTPSALNNAQINVPYTANIVAIDGTPPYQYSIITGFLPMGLTLSNSGAITGTPTLLGSSAFTVKAQDLNSNFGTKQYTLQVQNVAITMTPATLDPIKLNSYYTVTLGAVNGTAPYTFSLEVGSLPTGLSLDPVTGIISGRPTQVGTFVFGIKVIDFNYNYIIKDYELAVQSVSMSILPSSLPNGTINIAYLQTVFSAQGGTGPYNYSIPQGSLPSGMTFNNGLLSGTPTVSGTFLFKIRAADVDNNTVDQTYSLTINAVSISVAPATLPNGTVGTPYATTFTASGGDTPYTFSIYSGGLPPGMSLSNGALTGTPTSFGQWIITVRATDNNGNYGSMVYTLTVLPVGIGPSSIPSGTVNALYNVQLEIDNPYGTYTFAALNDLPSGLSLDSTGLISGMPLTQGPGLVMVSATSDIDSSFVINKDYTFQILPNLWKIEETTKGLAPITISDGNPLIFKVTAPNTVNPLAIVKLVAKVGDTTVASAMVALTNYVGTSAMLVTKAMLPQGVDRVKVYIENGTRHIVATYGDVIIS